MSEPGVRLDSSKAGLGRSEKVVVSPMISIRWDSVVGSNVDRQTNVFVATSSQLDSSTFENVPREKRKQFSGRMRGRQGVADETLGWKC